MRYKELQDAFIELTFILRGFDYADLESPDQNLVKLSYEKDSQPFQDLMEDICYVWANFADSRFNNQINEEQKLVDGSIKSIKSQLRKVTAHWVFYGNNAQDIAFEFRQRIFGNQSKEFLDSKGIKLIPEVPEVVLNYEEINNAWWSRIDLVVDYHIRTEFEEIIPVLESVRIQIDTENQKLDIK